MRCEKLKKILITGGAGFIGQEIVKQLYCTNEWDITVMDSLTEQIHGKNFEKSYLFSQIRDKCRFIRADVRDFLSFKRALADQEYIIHLAAETGTGQSMYQINHYNDVNIMGTSNLLQAISELGEKSKVKKIILSSSRAVYGEGKYHCSRCGTVYPKCRSVQKLISRDYNMYCPNCGNKVDIVPTTEDSLVQPESLYAFTKYSQERMIQTMCPALGLNYTIFRFQNVYGIGQSLKNPYTGILSIFSTLLLENKEVNIFEDGNESRDFINVKDIASGVIASLENKESNGEIINLGSGIGTSVNAIANFLKKRYRSNSKISITGDFRIGDIAHSIADITKAQNLLDFELTVSLETGLSDFCGWVERSKERDNSGYERSLKEMEEKGMLVRN